MEKVIQVANYVAEYLTRINNTDRVSMLKLQCLLYICDVECMKKNKGLPLFENDFYAWHFSPVEPHTYYGNCDIMSASMYVSPIKIKYGLSRAEKKVIEEAINQVQNLSTKQLSLLLTEKNNVWKKYHDMKESADYLPMSKEQSYEYYKGTKWSDFVSFLEVKNEL